MIGQRDRMLDKEKMSGPTTNRYLAALSAVFTWAVDEQIVDSNPVRQVRRPKEAGIRVRFLSDEELPRLIAACENSHHPDLLLAVVLALTTGLRQSELLGLTWEQVEWPRLGLPEGATPVGRIRLLLGATKNGEPRVVPLVGRALELLRGRFEALMPKGKPTGMIFSGKGFNALSYAWEKALKESGIEGFTWHSCRHHWATQMVANGESLTTLMLVGGWKSMNVVTRYAHLDPSTVQGVGERMANTIPGGAS
jgi:integrase